MQNRYGAAARPRTNGDASCGILLIDLKQAHDGLVAAMAELALVNRDAVGDRTRFTNARWRISQKSLGRRLLWNRILAYLQPRVGAEDAATLTQLQKADAELLRHSASHVRDWTTNAIEQKWGGYCEASRAIRWQMSSSIGAEKRLLYPLLGRCAEQGFGAH